MKLVMTRLEDCCVEIAWQPVRNADSYRVLWSDTGSRTAVYREMAVTRDCRYTLNRSTHIPHYLKIEALRKGGVILTSETLKTPVKKVFHPQREKLSRGLQAVKVRNGVFVSWRMFREEALGACETGLTGTDYRVYRNDRAVADVTDSTNYLDRDGKGGDRYAVAPLRDGREGDRCPCAVCWEKDYLDIPIRKPESGVTPGGQTYSYSANDMSVGDVDGDGEYEYIVKWDPSNSQDVSVRGYTGSCIIDCYKLDGQLLWRLDMGVNIRAGAHYTQFMVYDFNGDGRAEMAVKTAPGTCMTIYTPEGDVKKRFYVTMPPEDVRAGITHQDSFVCSAEDYRRHLAETFALWREHPEVKRGQWPRTLEECFSLKPRYSYPLKPEEALELADFYIREYAPAKDPRNRLDQFEGFIYEGPEYMTMFAGNGEELETIPFPIPREDDGLMWGDYAMARVEPCNRVDRFLSGVAYLDGERPYLLVCRGYYTRTAIVAYDFFENRFREYFHIDSGFVPMRNPFDDNAIHGGRGTDLVYGTLAGQGNHSLATADVDGDGCMEIIYGAAVIDHDGSLLYSSYGYRPDGVYAKLGHGDALHVARIDPDRPGYQIFSVFEGGAEVPYGYALRDAETGEVIFGVYAEKDLGRCMIGRIDTDGRGLQMWAENIVYDSRGRRLNLPAPGTNQSIRWAADLSTQVTDGPVYTGCVQTGVINDVIHGKMLIPLDTLTNNGTKGNPCLIADVFGDFREEILLRTADSSAIRIYMNTEVAAHKLFTLMHDTQYRCGVAWQNNCYNQPGYTSFYYADDMDFEEALVRSL
ncbi:MAG: rhamnogalacturonan lyase [Lachnospiraceae bacterium]|nr:rhamnogalacturonan lyase [Lachnospiraceae bacterium]